MNDLVEFLRARLDEDERVALAANAEGASPWFIVGDSPDGDDDVYLDTGTRRASSLGGYIVTIGKTCGCCGAGAIALPFAHHITHFDAARSLREVKAKRQLIGLYEAEIAMGRREVEAGRIPDSDGRGQGYWEALHAAVSLYDDHADYQPEWRANWRGLAQHDDGTPAAPTR